VGFMDRRQVERIEVIRRARLIGNRRKQKVMGFGIGCQSLRLYMMEFDESVPSVENL